MRPLRLADANGRAARLRRAGDVLRLVQMLQSEAPEDRMEAASALGRLKTPKASHDVLMRLARGDEHPTVRREAVLALGAATEPEKGSLCTTLAECLGDPHRNVRLYAAEALGRLRCRDAVPLLAERLENTDRLTRRYASSALAAIRHRSAVPALFRALVDRDKSVFNDGVRGLRTVMDQRDLDDLQPVIESAGFRRGRKLRRLKSAVLERS